MPIARATGWREEGVAMARVLVRQPLGQQALDRLADQFVARIAERGLDLRVDIGDPAMVVDRDDGIRGRLEDGHVDPTWR